MNRHGPDMPHQSIVPLPPDVVAQIKSSTAVTSLTGVVLGLVKNALDANARKVEVTVDFGRGGCSVEDDGVGIAPVEFREDGGLGKPYYTSKFYALEELLGRNGTFLASLAAMSLLTITSRHHEHRSHNSITFHHSKSIDRQLPAPAQHEFCHEDHGTRVTVRNLFGNLPVRVKQRAALVESRAEQDRLSEALKRDFTGLLLSSRRPAVLRVRDADYKTIFSFNGQTTTTRDARFREGFSADLHFALNVLTQASYIGVQDWTSWVPASASTLKISIRGAISLEPAPSKRVQFISMGARPLSADSEHNELYDEVNRAFALSSFGTIEDDNDVDENEKVRRHNDKRFKSEGYTNRQLRGRKGIDRYPMFSLRILLKDYAHAPRSEHEFLDTESNLQAVVDVLNAMITQWLSVHHFRPRVARKRRRPTTASTSDCDDGRNSASPGAQTQLGRSGASRTVLGVHSVNAEGRKKRVATPTPVSVQNRRLQQPFSEWSRIKRGKPRCYDTLWASVKHQSPTGAPVDEESGQEPGPQQFATFDSEPVLPGSLNMPLRPSNIASENDKPTSANSPTPQDEDETMAWTNPSTKQTFLLSARTGCVLPRLPDRTRIYPSIPLNARTLEDTNKSLRLPPKSTKSNTNTTEAKAGTPWLDNFLKTWDNPIFQPSQKRIPQATTEENQLESTPSGCSHSHSIRISQAFNDSSTPTSSKLSKQGLRNADVIAQVDKKFILVKMPKSSSNPSPEIGNESAGSILVLIDQHAADERIRIEALMSELCLPPSEERVPYRSKLGHSSKVGFTKLERPIQFEVSGHEAELFGREAGRFAAWGILFDIVHGKKEGEGKILTVTTLPVPVAQRCASDPKFLIHVLRETIYHYAENALPPSSSSTLLPVPPSAPQIPPNSESSPSPPWLLQTSTLPPALLSLLNSRACRSAIMFNDELSLAECQDLVKRLADTVFPFLCAHGRPSLVPLVDLGPGVEREGGGSAPGGDVERRGLGGLCAVKGDGDTGDTEGFVKTWRGWRERERENKKGEWFLEGGRR
ncbi:hypothetical protein BCR34DRAFT_568551 [Clohesyomyces aquaticus]|uniref:MutL C-terminal dimerisation domain-containing protein n=1 Tax=Clohesyomyces aquaticus TaxID=1231657 RepID=A0A1Y1ZGH9_9PLEO|nr:hypothetical protein BCR34DRAFT_568551 [Clohesyomyces aquaticus]